MNNMKELEIPQELYIEALEINSMPLSTDEKKTKGFINKQKILKENIIMIYLIS